MINARDWGMYRSLAFLRVKIYLSKKNLETFLMLEKFYLIFKIKKYISKQTANIVLYM